MSSGMFLIQADGQLVEMSEQPYDSEDLLQGLLAKYPNLMAGDQIDDVNPRRWLLISREAALPSKENGLDRWSVDHLFLDQDAIPTLVEVKKSSNTDIRRKVVGQMLDYAANAIVYWPIDKITNMFEATCKQQGIDPQVTLDVFLNSSDDSDVFWQKAKTNLLEGKIRMLFVADEIPVELRRIVEFLNSQMDRAEVLAVEIKQFVGQNQRSLIPRVIGQTEEATTKKATAKKAFTEVEFMEKCVPELRQFFHEVLDQASKEDFSIYWATRSFSVRKYLPSLNKYASVVYCQPEGLFSFYFAQLPTSNKTAETLRRDLLSYGIFRESGKKTLISTLNNETLDKTRDVVKFILGKVNEIAKNPDGNPSQL
jgi:hypothetical protein